MATRAKIKLWIQFREARPPSMWLLLSLMSVSERQLIVVVRRYESIKTETVPTSKQRGQLGGGPNTSESLFVSEDRGRQTADNIRYGQNILESGMGGKTAAQDGQAGQEGGYGGTQDQAEGQKDTRPQQRYGGGSGIGA
ncbi:hypothetical protein CLAIMM_05425 isoform 1 [Cladophialophora immunda]|nr:hypothetical protein CLAIMM_05425 isoform 1 [Cladophialophora immunda]